MLIVGILLLVVAAGAAFYAHTERRKARVATATETMSCGDIAALSSAVAGEVGGGDFTQRCEAVGAAAAGPNGLLQGPESGADAVWTRTKVTHKYWEMETRRVNDRTERHRVEKESTVSDTTSTTPFALKDATGSVVIHPDGATMDRPEQVLDRFDHSDGRDRAAEGFLDKILRATDDGGTIGFRHEEWIVRPGEELYVQGEVGDRTGSLVFEKPRDKGNFLVSTRSEEEIVQGAERNAKLAVAGAGVALVVGLALVVAGAVA